MAIDFSNRDPKDKNGVFSIEPASTPAWLNPKDWSGFTRDPAQKADKQEVGWATVTLNDGRKFRAILGPGGQPIAEIGDPFETDEKRAQAFSTATTQAAAAASQAARNVTSKYQGVFPPGHPRAGLPAMVTKYETGEPDYVEITTPAAQQDEWHTEGTPDGQGGFDNSTPIMARTVNGVRQTRQPDAKELRDWNEAGQMTRNPGGKTDAEIAADAAKAASRSQDQDMGSEQKTDPKTGVTTKTTTFKRPDGTIYTKTDTVTTDPKDATPRQTRVNPNDATKIQEFDPTANGGAGAWIDAGPNDAEAQRRAKEAEAKTEANKPISTRKPIIGKDGKPYTEVTEKNPVTGVTRTYHVNEAGQEVTLPGSAMAGITGLPSYTPDLTKPGAGLIDRAKQLDEMMAAGQLTWEQRQEILGQDQVLASTVANEFNAGVSLLQTNYANQTSQRNVDVSNVQHRASLANSHMQNAIGLMEHFAPYLGNTKGATGKLFMSAMAAQLGLATQYGGMQNIAREQMDPAVAAWAHRAVAGAGGPGAPGAAPGGLPAPGAPPAAPGVPPVAPGLPGQAPAPALGPARNRFDTGPGNTLGPRVMTPRSSGMPPPPQGYEPALSWRAGAQQQEDLLLPPDPNAVGTGEMAFGSMLPPVAPTDPMGGPMDFGAGAGVGPSPLAMSSAIPGLTPEQDEQARRELDRQIFAGARG